MKFKTHPKHNIAAVLCFICIAAIIDMDYSWAQNENATVKGTVIDATSRQAIQGMAVLLQPITAQGTVKQGGRTDFTKSDGHFEFEITAQQANDPYRLTLVKGSGGKQTTYGPYLVFPLNCRIDISINLACVSAANESASQARDRVSRIARLLDSGDSGVRALASYESYILGFVDEYQDDAFFPNADVASVVASLQRVPDEIALSDGYAWTKSGYDYLKQWKISGRGKPTLATVNRMIELPTVFRESSEVHRQPVGLTARRNGVILHGFGANCSSPIADISENGEIVSRGAVAYLTGLEAVGKTKFEIKAKADGTLRVDRPDGDDELTLDVGRLPVTATKLSRDGRRLAAATIDGTFKVWNLTQEEGRIKATLYDQGKTEKLFPRTIAFSPDGKQLVVGSGLKEKGHALTAINLESKVMESIDMKQPVSKIAFGPSNELSNMMFVHGGSGSDQVFTLNKDDQRVDLDLEFELYGIKGLAVSEDGEQAALLPEDKDEVISVPFRQLLQQNQLQNLEPFGVQE
ncbi:WD40 repeat domain-containing protein [Roseiconus lacunae]|uniref:WD40 repeat domain-containing protein n=1 Tax=Roseiconus lacunae TaxID=2605694 RepID=UPI001E409A9D|nr:WD40 repeat domain-containing protein [Roseiconus lacunae]MCD0462372.1 hypothetical protein [Roseiconus lacunae]